MRGLLMLVNSQSGQTILHLPNRAAEASRHEIEPDYSASAEDCLRAAVLRISVLDTSGSQ
jgi:hypothetical protein